MADLDLDGIAHMAGKAGIPETLEIGAAKDAVARFREVWAREGYNLPTARAVRGGIEQLLRVVPIARAG